MFVLFTTLKHPVALAATLVIQATVTCFFISSLTRSWFSYILFLIYIGAVLVLFIYISTLASNEKFKFSWITFILWIFILPPLSGLLFLTLPLQLEHLTPPPSNSSLETHISQVYDIPLPSVTSFIILYLLLTLLVVVKITSLNKGPLRKSK